MSRLPPRAGGFTLIEVLVALALMSLIGTILIESLRMGGRAWQRVTREAANIDEVSRAQEFLRQRLGAVYPPQPATDISASSESFVGENETLEFSSAPPGDSDEALMRYRLGLSASDPGTVEIRYRSERNAMASELAAAWSSEPLLAHTSSLSIQFWEDSAGSPGRWVDRWANTAKLPRLIRIDVQFAANDSRRWPPLYVEPRIDTRANCEFDVVGRRCRTGV
jgi:prepilin-type N-terminal cleavage/methylation domain-containing protein